MVDGTVTFGPCTVEAVVVGPAALLVLVVVLVVWSVVATGWTSVSVVAGGGTSALSPVDDVGNVSSYGAEGSMSVQDSEELPASSPSSSSTTQNRQKTKT